jgi:ribosomal subunit interface protein
MSFGTITYKYNGIEEAKELSDVVDQKLAALEKFVSEDADVSCEVEFEIAAAHLQGRIYRVEINLSIDGVLHRAEATEESFEKAIDEARNELDQELRRAKDKQVTLEKDAGRAMKEMLLSE